MLQRRRMNTKVLTESRLTDIIPIRKISNFWEESCIMNTHRPDGAPRGEYDVGSHRWYSNQLEGGHKRGLYPYGYDSSWFQEILERYGLLRKQPAGKPGDTTPGPIEGVREETKRAAREEANRELG